MIIFNPLTDGIHNNLYNKEIETRKDYPADIRRLHAIRERLECPEAVAFRPFLQKIVFRHMQLINFGIELQRNPNYLSYLYDKNFNN